ncbi:MAG TPA: peptidase C39 family protein [Hyphomicrobiales bacterium]|nr:peptidase C39 family protein [Hyphomicrobiales bacterium]
MDTPVFRPAGLGDVDALVAIEDAAFSTDRISRRSFRSLVAAPTAACIVAEIDGKVAGYAMLLFRAGTALARLYSIAVAPDRAGRGLGGLLLAEAERAAFDRDRILLRLEVREDNLPAIALYERAGYRRFGRYLDYYEDHADALRFEKLLRLGAAPKVTTRYYEQTTEFTCGPACLMMACAHFDPGFELDERTEVRLWREATTIFMTTGLGGCEPFGLAVTLAEHGLRPHVYINADGPLFLETVRNAENRRVMRIAQECFRARAAAMDIPVTYEALGTERTAEALRGGAVAIVLISGYRMFGKKVPHWVIAHGDDGRHIFIHDPWVEKKRGEVLADAANLPIPYGEFDRMARGGRDGLKATIIVTRG